MNIKKITLLFLTIITVFFNSYMIFANEDNTVTNETDTVSTGLYVSDVFESDYTLDEKDGKYVNFYIENRGDIAVLATINGEKERIFNPNDKGHIYVKVNNSIFGKSKEYTFRAVSEPVGAEIKIYYIIAQRDSQ